MDLVGKRVRITAVRSMGDGPERFTVRVLSEITSPVPDRRAFSAEDEESGKSYFFYHLLEGDTQPYELVE